MTIVEAIQGAAAVQAAALLRRCCPCSNLHPPLPDHSAAISFFKDLVRIPSLSREEGPIAEFICDYVERRGLKPKRLDDNVYVELGGAGPTLLLNSHLDVVPPSAEHPYPPFDAVEKDGKIYGRGTVDAKASGASMLLSLLHLHESGWKPAEGRVIVGLTTCEEIGGDYNGLQQLRPHLPKLDAALVGEPTEMQPCVAQRGLLILKLHAKGRSAHAARSHLGENAIYKAFEDIATLQQMTFEKTDPHLGLPSVVVTMIEGGTAKNMVPDVCTLTLDIRSTAAYSHDELIGLVSEKVKSEVEVYSKRLIPAATDVDAAIVKACVTALPNAVPFGSPTTSDWIFLSDIPTVKIGPGPSERSHTPHEHIEIDAFLAGVEGYGEIIKAYFNS